MKLPPDKQISKLIFWILANKIMFTSERNFQDNIFINFQRLLEIKYKLKIMEVRNYWNAFDKESIHA